MALTNQFSPQPILHFWQRPIPMYGAKFAIKMDTLTAVVDTNSYNEVANDRWCLDSGTSHHMTPITDIMTDIQPYEGKMTIMIGDGKILPITHTGTVSLITPNGFDIKLKKLYASPIYANLISIHKLTSDYPF